MSAITLLWRAKWRSSWRSLSALIVIVALGSGLTLAAMSGARRTSRAVDILYDRFNAADVYIPGGGVPIDPTQAIEAARQFENVVDLSVESLFFAFLTEETGISFQNMVGSRTDSVTVNQSIVRSGRLPQAEHEIALNRYVQQRTGLEIGETLEIAIADPYFENVVDYEFEVVGVVDRIEEVVQDATQEKPIMLVSEAFVDANRHMIGISIVQATAKPGTEAELAADFEAAGFLPEPFTATVGDQIAESVRLISITFGVVSILAALATAVVGSQLLVRTGRRSDSEARTLLAVGATTRQQLAVDGLLAASVGAAGVGLGIGVAIAASPIFPLGGVRRVPGVTGVDIDVAMLTIGAIALGLAFVSATVATATLERRRRDRQVSMGFVPAIAKGGPAFGTGIRFATGRQGLGLPVLSFTIGMTIAVAALTFMGSLGRLVDDPSRTGFTWDLASRETFAGLDTDPIRALISGLDDVEQAAGLEYSSMAIGDEPVAVAIVWPMKGPAWPPVYHGRTPTAPFEVLAGRRTLVRFGLELGDRVVLRHFVTDDDDVVLATLQHEFVIVGDAISPAFGIGGEQPPRLDEGIILRVEDIATTGGDLYGPSVLLFDLADGVDTEVFVEEYFASGFEDRLNIATEWFTSTAPSEVAEASAARPALLLAVATLSLVVLASVLHGTIGFVRERPGVFVVLSAIGFTPRQVRTVVRSQGLVPIVLSLLIAVPAGVGVGRWLWQLFANDIGVVPDPDVPWLAILGSLVGLLIVSNVALALPARRAQNVRVADTHRAT